MRAEYPCPVCEHNSWKTIGRFTYHRGQVHSRSEYDRLRWEVFFSLWYHDANEVALTTRVCQSCGFMGYAPRPELEDLERFYSHVEQGLGYGPSEELAKPDRWNAQRVHRVHAFIQSFLPVSALRILDVGGANGFMLTPFQKDGNVLDVVDTHPGVLPGMNKRADRIERVPDSSTYDLIIATHVLEHVDDPASMIAHIHQRLAPGGLLYLEVPNEIWKDIPIAEDPVTHVNYFNPENLRFLCERHGFTLRRERRAVERFSRWNVKVIGLLLKKEKPSEIISPLKGWETTLSLLAPGKRAQLAHAWRIQVPIKLRRIFGS